MQHIILTNANLVDAQAPHRGPVSIVIAGDRIDSVVAGGAALMSPGAVVTDLRGRYVTPGLFSCHYHAANGGPGGLTGRGRLPTGMDSPPALQAMRACRHVSMALQAGFTSVISAGAPFAIDASLKMAIEEGIIPGPRIMAGSRDVSSTGHSLDAYFPWHWEPGGPPGSIICDGPDEFRRGVRTEVKRGAEIIKMFVSSGHGVIGVPDKVEVTRDEFAAAIEAAHQRGAKVRAHITNKEAVLLAVDLGIDIVDHGDGLDEECIERMAAAGTFLVPSMFYPYRMAQEAKGVHVDIMREHMEKMMTMLPLADKAGVQIVLGDDYGAGALAHGEYGSELEFYAKVVGIAGKDVLRWATRNGAAAMGRSTDLGAIRPGALADLVVVDGDPLADVSVFKDPSRIRAVMKGGVFAKNTIDNPSRL